MLKNVLNLTACIKVYLLCVIIVYIYMIEKEKKMLEEYNKIIPAGALEVIHDIEDAGFEAYIVGGCVRDMLMGRTPHDWDITTSAHPDDVKKIFKRTYDTGIAHGTVTVIVDDMHFEVTTYRIEGKYEDHRRPNEVEFVDDINEDLSRRDFTMNAIAYHPVRGFVDPYDGLTDIKAKTIRSVRSSVERFTEDALRILRGVRFSAQLGFDIEENTKAGIIECRDLLKFISKERVREEFVKICVSDRPEYINVLHNLGLMTYIIPEFCKAYDTPQNHPHHIYNVGVHSVESMKYVPANVTLRLTMLLHDIGKIYTHKVDEKGIDHFHGHPKKSAQMAKEIMKDLRFDNHTINEVYNLCFYHDYHIKQKVDRAFVKKLMNRLGEKGFDDMMQVQYADAMAQNPDKLPPKLEVIEYEKAQKKDVVEKGEPYRVDMLCIKGQDLMTAGVPKGPVIGYVIGRCVEQVIKHPEYNEKDILIKFALMCSKEYETEHNNK